MSWFKAKEEADLIKESKLIQKEIDSFGLSIDDENVKTAFAEIKDGLLKERAYCVSKGYRDAARLYGDQAIRLGEAIDKYNRNFI